MQDIRDAPMRSRPSNRIWIRDILESNLIKDTNEIETRYGLIYRTHIMGTIVDLEFFSKKDGEDGIFDVDHEDGQEKTQNMNAVIDDGTGRIKVMAWSVSPAWQSAFKRGQFVQIIGPIREYDDFITKTRTKTILIEIIREETNPNCELYHDLKMIQNRLKKPQVEVQKQSKGVSINTSHSEEGTEFEETLDFEEDEDSLETINQMAESEVGDQIVPFFRSRETKLNAFENQVIEFIKNNDSGDGVNIKVICENLKKPEKEISKVLEKLSQQNLIYSSNPDFWSIT